jgi:proteasome accessory factor B
VGGGRAYAPRVVDRVERLTNLLALLLETPVPLSLTEIAGQLGGYPDGEVARRGAFERDKRSLRDIGVPIDTEIVPSGAYAGQTRYWIDRERFELADLHLEDDELHALQVAVAATRPGVVGAREALWKLGTDAVDDVAAVTALVPALPALPVLRDAAARRAIVRFGYHDVRREVEPYGLLLRDGFWYLVGFDRVRDARRVYRVDRIDGDVAADPGAAAFERPVDLDLRTAIADDPKAVGAGDGARDAIVRIDAPRAAAVVREVGDGRVVSRHDDGSIDVAVPCVNLPAFRSWVLGFVEHAEVIAPDDVRADVVAWLTSVART